MSSLGEGFMALTPDRKRVVHLALCEYAFAKWTAYTRSHGEITYMETVCGTIQSVDATLPKDALVRRSG
jgi:hypothetical protein